MEVFVDLERYNPLLRRKEIYCRISYEGKTPTREEVRSKISGLFAAEPERIVVDYIKTEFGRMEAKAYVKIYDSKEQLEKIEDKHILARNFGKKEEKGQTQS
ncbi:MAG: 30S ribosomal protein S24e [Archaeoglobales archaeon]|nr:30S ribosomal protein S24e [Archaeoglobales archaeon]